MRLFTVAIASHMGLNLSRPSIHRAVRCTRQRHEEFLFTMQPHLRCQLVGILVVDGPAIDDAQLHCHFTRHLGKQSAVSAMMLQASSLQTGRLDGHPAASGATHLIARPLADECVYLLCLLWAGDLASANSPNLYSTGARCVHMHAYTWTASRTSPEASWQTPRRSAALHAAAVQRSLPSV